MTERTKVIYIISAGGRSGSTLLSRILGQVDGFCDVGELRQIWSRGLLGSAPCGCDSLVRECTFWSSVVNSAIPSGLDETVSSAARLQKTKLRTRRFHHVALHLAGLNSPELDRYASIVVSLYRAIAKESGATYIVDSSKNPIDALLLSNRADLDFYALHLVRDPRGVAFSWRKKVPQPGRPGGFMNTRKPVFSSLQWTLWNLFGAVMKTRCHDKYLRLQYEELARDPAAAIATVLHWIGEAPSSQPIIGPHNQIELGVTHSVWGNPNRHVRGRVEIVPDEEWRKSMARSDYIQATVPALPLLWVFGYRMARRPQVK